MKLHNLFCKKYEFVFRILLKEVDPTIPSKIFCFIIILSVRLMIEHMYLSKEVNIQKRTYKKFCILIFFSEITSYWRNIHVFYAKSMEFRVGD